jgi:hypothetical protein
MRWNRLGGPPGAGRALQRPIKLNLEDLGYYRV